MQTSPSLGQELFSSISHGIGWLLSIIALILLFVLGPAPSLLKAIGISIFGISLIVTYCFSTLYHSLMFTKARKVFQLLDRAAIFVLIAGTYTPFLLTLLSGWERVISLLLLWSSAITGLTLQIFVGSRSKFLLPGIYLLLGWCGLLLIPIVFHSLLLTGGILLISGGIFYSLGVIFFLWQKLPYHHSIWHLFVLAGSLCHVMTVALLK